MNEFTACINATDLRRLTALLTDDQFRREYGGIGEQMLAGLGTPTGLPDGERAPAVIVDQVLLLPDGRVSAMTEADGREALTVFTKIGDRYLIDASYIPPPIQSLAASSCHVQPRPLQEFEALAEATPDVYASWGLGTPVASPTAPPSAGGFPAGPEIVTGITETVVEHIACMNLGDLPRITALWADAYLQRQFGGVDPGAAAVWATPQPAPEDQWASLVAIDDVTVMPDGHVNALVKTDHGMSLVAFVEVDGRYLNDGGFLPDRSGTPTP